MKMSSLLVSCHVRKPARCKTCLPGLTDTTLQLVLGSVKGSKFESQSQMFQKRGISNFTFLSKCPQSALDLQCCLCKAKPFPISLSPDLTQPSKSPSKVRGNRTSKVRGNPVLRMGLVWACTCPALPHNQLKFAPSEGDIPIDTNGRTHLGQVDTSAGVEANLSWKQL